MRDKTLINEIQPLRNEVKKLKDENLLLRIRIERIKKDHRNDLTTLQNELKKGLSDFMIFLKELII